MLRLQIANGLVDKRRAKGSHPTLQGVQPALRHLLKHLTDP